jgi:hypothetical protein
MPSKAATPTPTQAPKSKLAQLKAQIAEQLNASKQEFSQIIHKAVEYVEGLEDSEIKQIVSDRTVKPALKALGLQVVSDEVPANPTKRKTKAKRGTRRSKVSDEEIVTYLKAEHSVGDIRKDLGQLVPKRLAGLKKAGKIEVRQEGVSKLWKAV